MPRKFVIADNRVAIKNAISCANRVVPRIFNIREFINTLRNSVAEYISANLSMFFRS